MAIKSSGTDRKTQNSMFIFIVIGLSCFFYGLGAWQKSGFGKGDSIALTITKQTDCMGVLSNLNYETHHDSVATNKDNPHLKPIIFKSCDKRFTDYTPCQDRKRSMKLSRANMFYRERHCPSERGRLYCLIPAPKGYVTPFPWPKSRDYVAFANVPHKTLTIEKAVQNWVQYEGDVFRFPGGGTQFPQGADKYIDQLASVIPFDSGMIRTALDTGCGVASLGAYLLKRNILTMSFAPRDSHEAQVQFALERGVPAVIGVFGTIRLPYPSGAFDMAHCSRCLIPWDGNDGMYLMEVDRVLRPGGYWILSGPPISWKTSYKDWNRPKEELQEAQRKIEKIAQLLCWDKISEKGEIAVWRKRINGNSCPARQVGSATICQSQNSDDVWYRKMEVCVSTLPAEYDSDGVVGGELKPFPDRLNAIPPRISSGAVPGISVESYYKDNKLWKKHMDAYKRYNKIIDSGRYRNIMDMNAGLGGFAAAIESSKSWVMNVVPTIAEKSTLGVIYNRGLIGIYHDWCEGFSTYPRTYDLIHGNDLFSLYNDKCKMEDILLEMDRILRPEGTVILRDDVGILIKVKRMADGMRWNTRMMDHEDGPLVPQKTLYAVKRYWVVEDAT